MARRTPFGFRDHYDPADFIHLPDGLVERLIDQYEDALATEYVAGDIDVASYYEGIREATEGVLVDLLGIDRDLLDQYWRRGPHATPALYDLPFTGGNQLIDYAQIEAWTGQRLDARQWERLNEAIGHSSIPDAIATIVASITDTDPSTDSTED